MMILNQDKKTIVNLDTVTSIELELAGDGYSNEIYAEVIDHSPVSLGVYVTKERATEVFMHIADCFGGPSIYKMPEE